MLLYVKGVNYWIFFIIRKSKPTVRIKLRSNLQGLYRSVYEGDEFSWETGMKLQEALTNFRNELPSQEM